MAKRNWGANYEGREKRRRKFRNQKIVAAWERFVDSEPDISSERLLTMIIDDTGAEIDEICRALVEGGKLEEPIKN